MRVFEPTRIRQRRRTLGMTQAILAEKANTIREHIADIERGISTPKVDLLARIAFALRVREHYFFENRKY